MPKPAATRINAVDAKMQRATGRDRSKASTTERSRSQSQSVRRGERKTRSTKHAGSIDMGTMQMAIALMSLGMLTEKTQHSEKTAEGAAAELDATTTSEGETSCDESQEHQGSEASERSAETSVRHGKQKGGDCEECQVSEGEEPPASTSAGMFQGLLQRFRPKVADQAPNTKCVGSDQGQEAHAAKTAKPKRSKSQQPTGVKLGLQLAKQQAAEEPPSIMNIQVANDDLADASTAVLR